MYPESKVDYRPDASIKDVGTNYNALKRFDDTSARDEWGWQPRWGTEEEIIRVFGEDIKKYPARYGL